SMAVTESDGGTTAANLGIAQTASTTGSGAVIDGALQKTITVTASDTLTTLENKINQLGFGVSASIINDGSKTDPYRLSLTSLHSGTAGQVTIDSGTTGLNATTLIKAQDAAVFYGDGSSTGSLLLTSSTNTLADVIKGVTVTLNGVSKDPVTLNITRDTTAISKQLNDFVTNFNAIVTQIDTLTAFDTTTDKGGLLLGDATVQRIQADMYDSINTVVKGAGQFKTLADLGITITDGAKLQFDASTFDAAYAKDPTAVQNFFTQAKTGAGNVIQTDFNNLVDAQTGVIPNEENTLDSQTAQYQTRMDELNKILDSKRSRLEMQFANLESVLSNLQSQQSSLASIGGGSASSSSK
ncbi:MAG: flagellar filament capping protein FliD, partial [Phycisphaerae bacterium]|nr:flagellar filament capping protein FliD [Phycisphaerae bacterium]